MKDLIVSTLIVIVLIGGWLLFDDYSRETNKSLSEIIDNQIIPLTEIENWDDATTLYDIFVAKWNKYKKTALSFLENNQLSEIDLCVARAEKYIEAKDVSNSAGELCSIATQLKLLYTREKVTISNIL